jgi:hypothetical protein
MNKRTIVASLNEIANELDNNGLFKEANEVTEVMVKLSQYTPPPGSLGAYFNDLSKTPPNEGWAISTITVKIQQGDIEGAKKVYTETLKKLKDPSNFIREVSPMINNPEDYKLPEDGETPVNPSNPTKPIGTKKPTTSPKPGAPSSKPSTPGKPVSITPTNTDGLDRWINKAENIYKAWGQKGANPNSSAFGLVKDIVDYMQKVKSNLPTSLHGQADAKIAKVQGLLGDIFDGNFNPAFTPVTLPYSSISGYPKKGVDPFGTGQRMQGNALDYQARQEGKSY